MNGWEIRLAFGVGQPQSRKVDAADVLGDVRVVESLLAVGTAALPFGDGDGRARIVARPRTPRFSPWWCPPKPSWSLHSQALSNDLSRHRM
jgi:hypothetical protein